MVTSLLVAVGPLASSALIARTLVARLVTFLEEVSMCCPGNVLLKAAYLYVSEFVVCKDEGVSSPIVNTSMAIIIITNICWCDELISGHIDYLVNVGCRIHDNKVAACICTEYRD